MQTSNPTASSSLNSSVTTCCFPLFSAILQVSHSTYTQSASYVHATCLNLIVGILRITDPPVRRWITAAEPEQVILCEHLCDQLVHSFVDLAGNTTGPIVDGVRHTGLQAQLGALEDLLDVISDTFWCNVAPLNEMLCERLLQTLVTTKLLAALAPVDERNFLEAVGVSDYDVIPVGVYRPK